MSYAPIDVELMRSRLMSVDVVKERLAPTEGLGEFTFETDGSSTVRFDYPDDWNVGLDRATDGFTLTSATVTVDGHTFPMTKDAACEAGSKIGLQKSYMLNTPGTLVTPHLNYHYHHGANGLKEVKILAGENAVAFTRGTVQPFSNHALVDAALVAIQEKYGTDDVLVDYKFHHDLEKTKIRLIVPSHGRSIGSARAASAGEDPWSVGLEISNSTVGASSLEIGGYLFAWWCTNGETFDHVSSGKYRRKPSLTPDDAYEWARGVVDDVLGDLENEFDTIESLTRVNLAQDLNATANRMFERFGVPANARERIMANLVESDDLTAYGLMNSITAAANDEGLSEGEVSSLLRAGGQVAHVLSDRCDVCHRF